MSAGTRQSPWWRVIKQAGARWVEVDGDQRAAAFAHYLLLSLLPLTTLFVSAASLFVDRQQATQALVNLGHRYTALTAEQESTVMAGLHGMLEARGTVSLAAIPLLLWGSLKFLRTLIRTSNRVWRSSPYNWWRLPLKSLGLLGITVSVVLFGILLPGWVQLVEPWLTTRLDLPRWMFGLLFHFIPWVVLFYGLLMIYRMAPSRPTTFSEVWIGALGATVLIRLGERLFLIYAADFARFDVYGALGGIVLFLVWLYLAGCAGVFGICFCAAQAGVRGEARDHPERDLD